MQTASEALWDEANRFGQAASGLVTNVYEINSKQRAKQEINSLAEETQAFHDSLRTDPDAGTPIEGDANGQASGYMKKWLDFDKKMKDKIDKIDSPLARTLVQGYWDQESLQSQNQVSQEQFKAWAGNTVAESFKRIDNSTNTWAGEPQGLMDYISGELDDLKGSNLLSQADYDNALSNYSQIALRKNIVARGKAAYDAAGGGDKGLTEALSLVEHENTNLSHKGNTYALGDQTRDAVKRDLLDYDQIVQREEGDKLETWYSNILLQSQGKAVDEKHPEILTFQRIQNTRATPEVKKYWFDQLTQLYNQKKGSAIDKAEVNQAISYLKVMAERINTNEGRGGIEYLNFNGKKIPITVDGFVQLRDQYAPMIAAADDSSLYEIEKLYSQMSAPDQGSWASAFKMLDSIKDGARRDEVREQLRNIKDQYSGSGWTPEKIMEVTNNLVAQKAYKANFLGRFEYSPKGILPDTDDKMSIAFWDKQFTYSVGARPGQPAAPQSPANRDALNAYQAAQAKEFDAIFGKDTTAQNIWMPTDADGNYLPVQVREKDGKRQTIMSVPVINDDGKRENGVLVCTTTTGQAYFDRSAKGVGALETDGPEPPKYQLYDYETGQLKDVGLENRYDDGWSFKAAGERATDNLLKTQRRNEYNYETTTAAGRAQLEARTTAAQAAAQQSRRDSTKEAINKTRGR